MRFRAKNSCFYSDALILNHWGGAAAAAALLKHTGNFSVVVFFIMNHLSCVLTSYCTQGHWGQLDPIPAVMARNPHRDEKNMYPGSNAQPVLLRGDSANLCVILKIMIIIYTLRFFQLQTAGSLLVTISEFPEAFCLRNH